MDDPGKLPSSALAKAAKKHIHEAIRCLMATGHGDAQELAMALAGTEEAVRCLRMMFALGEAAWMNEMQSSGGGEG